MSGSLEMNVTVIGTNVMTKMPCRMSARDSEFSADSTKSREPDALTRETSLDAPISNSRSQLCMVLDF